MYRLAKTLILTEIPNKGDTVKKEKIAVDMVRMCCGDKLKRLHRQRKYSIYRYICKEPLDYKNWHPPSGTTAIGGARRAIDIVVSSLKRNGIISSFHQYKPDIYYERIK